ncbi:MAG: hypothetical protein LBV80_08170 [Deltaproteobacteria bacterium]|jgi:hypothetical protein|nr:hypothetical protein [Deltaproteobacteria bacterium]
MRIIIDNRTTLPADKVLTYIEGVMRMGLVSGNNDTYCYLSAFKDGTNVSARKIKTGHSFVVWQDKPKTAGEESK